MKALIIQCFFCYTILGVDSMLYTIVGYFSLLFGVVALIFPKLAMKKDIFNKNKDKELGKEEIIGIRLAGVISIIVGIILILNG